MTRKELLESINHEWGVYNSITNINNPKYSVLFDVNKIRLKVEVFIKGSADLTSRDCISTFKNYINLGLPGYQLLKIFLQQYENKSIDDIVSDDLLKKIVFNPIPVNKNELISENISEIVASKIKNKKDKTGKKSTSVDFDVFNTF